MFWKNYWAMKYLGLWSPGLRIFFWKICKTLHLLPSYILNVRSLSIAKRYCYSVFFVNLFLYFLYNLFKILLSMRWKFSPVARTANRERNNDTPTTLDDNIVVVVFCRSKSLYSSDLASSVVILLLKHYS